jgi:mRNA-degrading endonuclease RelE of RelBE toxin-antitoxin system
MVVGDIDGNTRRGTHEDYRIIVDMVDTVDTIGIVDT